MIDSDGDKEIVSYVGLNLMIRVSDDSRIEGSISNMDQVAFSGGSFKLPIPVVHTSNDEYLSRFYERLASRKNSQKAIVATVRKMLVSIYHMLDRGEVYGPPGVSA